MKKTTLGLLLGTLLGFLDGLSAIFNPEAQEMLSIIIVSATAKGTITGLIIGFVARKIQQMIKLILVGTLMSTFLSILAAIPSGSFIEIVVPGTVIGLLLSMILGKFGKP